MPNPHEHRLMELAAAHAVATEANGAFATKFANEMEALCRQYVAENPTFAQHQTEEDRLWKAQADASKGGPLSDLRQEAFEACFAEWEARRKARARLGALKRGCLSAGRALQEKYKKPEQE